VAAQLDGYARDARTKTWRDTYRQYLDPRFYLFLGYEESASRIRHFEPYIVPAPLQTPDYSRQLALTFTHDEDRVRIIAAMTDARRQSWQALDGQRTVEIILDESVLHRRVGTNRTMRDQLTHLHTLAKNTDIEIRILPLYEHSSSMRMTSFHLFDVAETQGEQIVFVENPLDDIISDVAICKNHKDIRGYNTHYEWARTVALSPAETVTLLDQLVASEGRCICRQTYDSDGLVECRD
jgi:hypothetical protein